MKKTFIILALLATAMCASAQIDTLRLGNHNPVYYYSNAPWWDEYALNDPVGKTGEWHDGGMHFASCQAEYARYCYTDTSLRIIGIAAGMKKRINWTKYDEGRVPDSVVYKKALPEYFRLFEVDSTGDSMHLMAQGQWTVYDTPALVMQSSVEPHYEPNFVNVYEVYFDEPVTVYDSFYVGVTGNNKWVPPYYAWNTWGNSYPYVTFAGTHYCFDNYADNVKPQPTHYKCKLHFFNYANYDYHYNVTDTNWHTRNKIDILADWTNNVYMFIFPIIDTSHELVCQQSRNLTLAYRNGGIVTLVWEGGYNAQQWELSMCNDDCAPDSGTITQWTSRLATVAGLEKGTWYTAWVRSVCDSVHISDWCDSIRFYIPDDDPNDPDDPESIETTADRYTYLMPNPASETVTVASSFRIAEVELFSLDGRSLLRSKVDAMSTTLNLDALAAGTYIVRIATNGGTTYKKLVVK